MHYLFLLVFIIGLITVLMVNRKTNCTGKFMNMAHIDVAEGVPGIRSLVMFRPERVCTCMNLYRYY
jgi:hypothetical protein